MVSICLSEELYETLSVNKVDPKNEYIPAYGGESAGLDLYNCGPTIDIKPSNYKPSVPTSLQKVLIPTGVRIDVPRGYVALIQERGSVTKTPLKVRAGVIDSGYTGEVFVNCINTGPDVYTIYAKRKLPFQIVVVKCDNDFQVVSEEEYLDLTSTARRQEGQVGSSD